MKIGTLFALALFSLPIITKADSEFLENCPGAACPYHGDENTPTNTGDSKSFNDSMRSWDYPMSTGSGPPAERARDAAIESREAAKAADNAADAAEEAADAAEAGAGSMK